MPEDMNIPLIVGVVAAVVILIVIATILMKRPGKRKLPEKYERELSHSVLVERSRRYQNILIYLPPHYLPRDLKMMIVLGMLSTLEQLKKLGYEGEEEKTDNKLASAKEMLAQMNVGTDEPPVRPITRPDKAKEARELLDSVKSFVLYMTEHGQMDPAQTDVYLETIDHLKFQTHLDLIDSAAKKAEQDEDYDTAIETYRQAIDELSEKMGDEYYVDKIATYNDKINKLTRARAEASNFAIT